MTESMEVQTIEPEAPAGRETSGSSSSSSTAVATVVKPARLLRPIAPPAELMEVQNEVRAMLKASLKEGRDYGTVQGIDKPFLFKAGAERIALAMGCYYGEPRLVERECEHDRVVQWQKRRKSWKNRYQGDREFDWEIETGESLGLYRYVLAVPVIDRATGNVVGEGIGSCSTMESKYIDRARDSENTVIKMAHKRALVAGALLAFGLSDEFTQDEDVVEGAAPNGRGSARIRATATATGKAPAKEAEGEPECPKCGGKMWDNREGKKNPKAPDYKCRDKSCDGAFWPGQWPPKEEEAPDATKGKAPEELKFPAWAQFPDLKGRTLGEIDTADLRDAAAAAREKGGKGSDALADAIDTVLDGRAEDADSDMAEVA